MKRSLIHSTDNNNHYIYDDQSRLSMFIHPAIKDAYENQPDVSPYYLRKYEYLKKHGFFSDAKSPRFEVLDENSVMDSIIQTSQIVFEITESCNLNCVYCGYGDLFQVSDKRNHSNLNIDNAIKLLQYILHLKIKSNKNRLMIGFYGGEPLLNANFIKQIIEETERLNVNKKLIIEYSMTTNATLINKHIDFLALNNVQLAISLDGNKPAHSYRISGKDRTNSFEKVIENVDLVREKYPEYFDKHVNFISVLHNKNSVKEIYEFIYTRYHKIPEIVELNTNGCKPDKKGILNEMFHSKWISEAEYRNGDYPKIPAALYESLFFRDLSAFIRHYSVNHFLLNKTSLFKLDEKFFPTGTCLPFSLKMFLTTHNMLLPCEKIDFKYALGEVGENVQIDIEKIVDKYNRYFECAVRLCKNCYNYKFCGSCVFHFKNIDKYETEEVSCDYFKDQESFEKDLCHKFSYLERNPNDFFYILENSAINNK